MKFKAWIAIGIYAVLLSMGHIAKWGAEKEFSYHDKIYKSCMADGKKSYECDALAWQATRGRFK